MASPLSPLAAREDEVTGSDAEIAGTPSHIDPAPAADDSESAAPSGDVPSPDGDVPAASGAARRRRKASAKGAGRAPAVQPAAKEAVQPAAEEEPRPRRGRGGGGVVASPHHGCPASIASPTSQGGAHARIESSEDESAEDLRCNGGQNGQSVAYNMEDATTEE